MVRGSPSGRWDRVDLAARCLGTVDSWLHDLQTSESTRWIRRMAGPIALDGERFTLEYAILVVPPPRNPEDPVRVLGRPPARRSLSLTKP
jgi:hypothetical protein